MWIPSHVISDLDSLVASASNLPFANITSFTSGTITSSSSLITSSLSVNTSCSSCVIAADGGGLQQIFWFSETWSVTLDTEHVTVTSYNGSNASAVTNTRTVLGNVTALDTIDVPYVASLMLKLDNEESYFNPDPTLVRGINGSVGTTSFPYGQAFAELTAVNYRYMLPSTDCPLNMGEGLGSDGCACLMNSWWPAHVPLQWIDSSYYTMDRTYYQPLSSSVMNEDNAGGQDDAQFFQQWDGEKFKAWLAEDKAFRSAIPNWEDCAFWNVGKTSFLAVLLQPADYRQLLVLLLRNFQLPH